MTQGFNFLLQWGGGRFLQLKEGRAVRRKARGGSYFSADTLLWVPFCQGGTWSRA